MPLPSLFHVQFFLGGAKIYSAECQALEVVSGTESIQAPFGLFNFYWQEIGFRQASRTFPAKTVETVDLVILFVLSHPHLILDRYYLSLRAQEACTRHLT